MRKLLVWMIVLMLAISDMPVFGAETGEFEVEAVTPVEEEAVISEQFEEDGEEISFELGVADGDVDASASDETSETTLSLSAVEAGIIGKGIITNGQCGDNVFWDLYDNRVLYIRGTGAMWDYDDNGGPWSKYSNAYGEEDLIDKVVIESGVTIIGKNAFLDCGAREFDIASSVTAIGEGAFCGCSKLGSIDLPDGIKIIPYSAFSDTGLQTIKWPASLQTIGKWAFSNTILKKVELPGGLRTIEEQAFSDSGVEEIYIPASVTLIDNSAFSRCDRIRVIQVASGNETYFAADNTLYLKEMDFLVRCATAKTGTFVVPSSIEYIGAYAFEMSHYSKIVLPGGLKSIGRLAFHGCFDLTAINIPPSATSIDSSAFVGWSPDGSQLENLTAYVVEGSLGESIIKDLGLRYDNSSSALMPFYKGFDNFSFINSREYFGRGFFGIGEKYYVTSDTRERMLGGLSAQVRKKIARELDSYWGGSCYGMSTIIALLKHGSVHPWEIQANKYNLYSITKSNNDEVESFINYYQCMQYLPKVDNEIGDTKRLTLRAQINKIIDCGERGIPFLIAFYMRSGGGHAIVGYGRESGSFTVKGSTFNTKIPTYDPNCPNYDSAIYCNTHNDSFIMTYDGGIRDVSTFVIISNDKALLNQSYKDDGTTYKYPSLNFSSGATQYAIHMNGRAIAVAYDLDDAESGLFAHTGINDTENGNLSVMLLNGEQDFSVAVNGSADFSYNSSDGFYEVDAEKTGSVAFSKDGGIAISGASGAYGVTLTVDDAKSSIPWTETRVSGRDTDIAINPVDDGIVVSSRDLSNVTIVAVNDSGETAIDLDTDKGSVLVAGSASSGKPEPIVYEDVDGDSVYETSVTGAESVALTGGTLKKLVNIGDKLQIHVPDFDVIAYKSSKTKVATVTADGYVVAMGEGSTKITVSLSNKKKRTLSLTVVDPYKPSGVSIAEGKSVTLSVGSTFVLNAVLSPASARSTLTWQSSKTKVAEVDANGVVTPKAEGTAKITVTTANKKKATISVKVVDPYKPSKVSLEQTGTVKLGVGQSLQLNAVLTPDTAKTTLTWKSSAKKTATVSDSGLVTGVKKGSCTITVKTANGKTAKVKVEVVESGASVGDWLSSFESGKSGITVYCSSSETLFHAKSECPSASDSPSLVPLETALNAGKEPCPSCLADAAATAYVSRDDAYYHSDKGHAHASAIATNVAKARAYGLAACPTCYANAADTPATIDARSDAESIRYVQELLNSAGLLSERNINGTYEADTEDAVKRFQEWVNDQRGEYTVEVTGTVDELTRMYLEWCRANDIRVS